MTSLFGLVFKTVVDAGVVVTGGNSALILASKLKAVSCPTEDLPSTFESKTVAAFSAGLELA